MNRSAIEQRATEILRDHGLLTVPVDPLKVAKALRVRVLNVLFSEPDKSGAAVKRAGTFSILVNANDAPARKRFTIAHELGHSLLHMANVTDGDISDSEENYRSTIQEDPTWNEEKRREWEANQFAAALLMNAELLRQELATSTSVPSLAWKFQVSESAMSCRLGQLGLLKEIA